MQLISPPLGHCEVFCMRHILICLVAVLLLLSATNGETPVGLDQTERPNAFNGELDSGTAQSPSASGYNEKSVKFTHSSFQILSGTMSANPTSQPTTTTSTPQPSTKPTNPTEQPSSQPSFDENYQPVVKEQYRYRNLSYACHPTHLHSTPNVFQRIFYGLTLDSAVAAQRVLVWMDPYTPRQDQLGVLRNDYENVISANFSAHTGVLEFASQGDQTLTSKDWNAVLNYPTYRLFLNSLSPRACERYTDGLYTPSIHLQVIDRYGRKSNIVSKKLVVSTSVLLYSSDMPVVVDNSVAVTTLSMKQSVFDPIHNLANITGTPNGVAPVEEPIKIERR